MVRYTIGDEVLRRGGDGIRRGRIVDVVSVVADKPAVYQVRVGRLTHLEEECNLRPAGRTNVIGAG